MRLCRALLIYQSVFFFTSASALAAEPGSRAYARVERTKKAARLRRLSSKAPNKTWEAPYRRFERWIDSGDNGISKRALKNTLLGAMAGGLAASYWADHLQLLGEHIRLFPVLTGAFLTATPVVFDYPIRIARDRVFQFFAPYTDAPSVGANPLGLSKAKTQRYLRLFQNSHGHIDFLAECLRLATEGFVQSLDLSSRASAQALSSGQTELAADYLIRAAEHGAPWPEVPLSTFPEFGRRVMLHYRGLSVNDLEALGQKASERLSADTSWMTDNPGTAETLKNLLSSLGVRLLAHNDTSLSDMNENEPEARKGTQGTWKTEPAKASAGNSRRRHALLRIFSALPILGLALGSGYAQAPYDMIGGMAGGVLAFAATGHYTKPYLSVLTRFFSSAPENGSVLPVPANVMQIWEEVYRFRDRVLPQYAQWARSMLEKSATNFDAGHLILANLNAGEPNVDRRGKTTLRANEIAKQVLALESHPDIPIDHEYVRRLSPELLALLRPARDRDALIGEVKRALRWVATGHDYGSPEGASSDVAGQFVILDRLIAAAEGKAHAVH